MKITEASLCLRFYPSSDWTRQAVCDLLKEDNRLARVVPRYFDERDNIGAGWELDDDLPHDDCDYFAVYDVPEPFSPEALAAHDIITFHS